MDEKRFKIAGVQHHQLHTIITSLEVGDELELVPEPENKFDPNAIKIMKGGVMCGYVPKKFSAEVSAMLELEDSFALHCIITDLNIAKPWEHCEVAIRSILDEEEFNPEYEDEFRDTDFESDDL